MKKKMLVLAVVVITAATLLSVGTAQASITSTKHNLSPTGTGTIHATSGQQNGEICVWCHTPHLSNTSFSGAPIWNKATPSGSYTMYGTTIAGTATAGSPGAVSKACLSCHDGVSAINSLVLQAPYTAGYNSAGYNVAFGTTSAGTGTTMPTGVSNLGTNLVANHPVSITYTAGKASLVATTTSIGGTATIGSLLYSGAVECASCHDPHVATGDTSRVGTTSGAAMTIKDNAGSALCLLCHAK